MRRLVFAALLAVLAALLAVPALATDTKNQVSDWCEVGVKFDNLSGASYTVPEPPEGTTWTLLVIKSSTDNETWVNPVPGQSYTPTNGHDVSHVILCYVEAPTTTTTTIPETTTTTVPETTTTTTTVPETTTTTVAETTTTTDPSTTTTVADTTTTSIPTGVPTGEPLQGGGALDRAVSIGVLAALALTGAFARRKWLTR